MRPMLLAAVVLSAAAAFAGQGTFTEVGRVRGLGHTTRAIVGPGPTPGSERLYVSYTYGAQSADVVAIDPVTGVFEVFPVAGQGVTAAWALVPGPDGMLYGGTDGDAKIFRIDPKEHTIRDVGRAAESESYLWQLTVGPDRKLYGCTYPSAKLIRFDPATGKLEDLGRVDPSQQYARYVVASDDGFVYVGAGFERPRVVAYEIATSTMHDLTPPVAAGTTGVAEVFPGADGRVHVSMPGEQRAYFRLDKLTATPEPKPLAKCLACLASGAEVVVEEGFIKTKTSRRNISTAAYRYSGKELEIFRVGATAEGVVYGSTLSPMYLFRFMNPDAPAVNLANGSREFQTSLGGEVYSIMPFGRTVWMGAYSGPAPVMVIDPARGFDFDTVRRRNPLLLQPPDVTKAWRPLAMLAGPARSIYIGSISGYGVGGGSLTVVDTATMKAATYQPFPGQSVVSLAQADGLLIGATSTEGGGGVTATTKEARLFLWDPLARKTVYDVVPVPGAPFITGLTVSHGRVFGVAGERPQATQLFVFDLQTREIVHRAALPVPINTVTSRLHNSMAEAANGRIYGLFAGGIFSLDPVSYEPRVEARYEREVTGGFALVGYDIYFAAGPSVVRYSISPY